jgi:predicted RNA binding protein YcfA (HicA-like mRNA interferase family)
MQSPLDQRDAIKFLSDFGWRVGRPGRHAVKMVKRHHRPITLPRHHGGTYSKSLTYRIVKQAGLEPKDQAGARVLTRGSARGTICLPALAARAAPLRSRRGFGAGSAPMPPQVTRSQRSL